MPTRTEFKLKAISTLTLRELRRTDLEQAAQILGRGMNDNPIIVRVFATLHEKRHCRALERFFRPVLHGLYQRGLINGAYRDDALAGVCGIARPGFCQPTPMEKLSVVPSMVGNSIDTTLQDLNWVGEWAHRDPVGQHWGLGPGTNAFTVTAVPAAISARPRANPRTADLQVIQAVIVSATEVLPGEKLHVVPALNNIRPQPCSIILAK